MSDNVKAAAKRVWRVLHGEAIKFVYECDDIEAGLQSYEFDQFEIVKAYLSEHLDDVT